MNRLVSILIPVYNRENLIEETVRSAINQTYTNIEIIIVDNASEDNTWDILQKLASQDSRIKIFQNETNIGPVRNWKRCIDEASGEYGKILWSDDLMAPEFLEKTVPFLENEDVGFVFTGTEIFIDNTSEKRKSYFIGNSGVYKTEQFINGVLFDKGYPVSPGCAIFRLKDLNKNLLVDIPNKINSDFSMHAIGNDLLLFLLTAHQYNYFAFIEEALSFFRAHGDSITSQSNNGKLLFHYDIAKAYFVETYRGDLVKSMNYILLKDFKIFSKNDNYNKYDMSHFYMINNEFSIDYMYWPKKVYRKLKETVNE